MAVAGSLPESNPGPPEALSIDCDECALQHTEACADCVVTFLCGMEASTPVVVDLAEARALRELDVAGLAPPLRHRRRTG
ncbi:hypothetical protein KSP35_05770 [Aquihabitans sp. G128]|uniref:hypothetical protein n=1 Tax=Aquihabitans sp. G128 TaxID=2849779 RepID=UPI001C23BC81|nr:hypothetical protein [Aquihabitans sp. G128]QXC62312.1 hypothetical protein KSP35_05770 [Aquihabitans sp. G128]